MNPRHHVSKHHFVCRASHLTMRNIACNCVDLTQLLRLVRKGRPSFVDSHRGTSKPVPRKIMIRSLGGLAVGMVIFQSIIAHVLPVEKVTRSTTRPLDRNISASHSISSENIGEHITSFDQVVNTSQSNEEYTVNTSSLGDLGSPGYAYQIVWSFNFTESHQLIRSPIFTRSKTHMNNMSMWESSQPIVVTQYVKKAGEVSWRRSTLNSAGGSAGGMRQFFERAGSKIFFDIEVPQLPPGMSISGTFWWCEEDKSLKPPA